MGLAAPAAPRTRRGAERLLEVRLGQHVLSDGIAAYQQGDDVLLPLGELARLLTIAIRTNPDAGTASGYILDEQRGFRLDLAETTVARATLREPYDPMLVRRGLDEIYVASRLLSVWLPVDFELDMASLVLAVRPRDKLPLQARLERQRNGAPEPG